MKIFLFGTGYIANNILKKIPRIPQNIKILGFIDNDSTKWGGQFYGKPVCSPQKLKESDFDDLIILSDVYFEAIKEELTYWYKIDSGKIKGPKALLKLLLKEKYKNTENKEIQKILRHWENNEISVYNQYVNLGLERHYVQWDCMENMPYIVFEEKRMYFPYDYRFIEYEGKKLILDLTAEQQRSSPHLYMNGNHKIEDRDVIADAGVMEGNFSLRYIEKVSKAYLFECDTRWIRPLQKTFEKFKDKVVLCNRFLGQFSGGKYIKLDDIITGRLDFLKMDIEGTEIEALLGGRNTILNNNVKCSICSYHKSGDEAAIKDVLNSYGYQTSTSKGYMLFYWDENIFSTLDFRKGIVYADKYYTS